MMSIRGVSSNLSTMYGDLPFEARIAAAAEDGFACVEFWTARDHSAAVKAIRREALGVSVVNVPQGRPQELGRLSHPEARPWWRDQFLETIAFAQDIACPAVNLLCGSRLPIDPEEQTNTMLENLQWALEQSDVSLLLEPLNGQDRPGYFLDGVDTVVSARKALGDPPRLLLLFDAYHLHQLHGSVADLFQRTSDFVGHVQVADYPGRGQPGTGTIDIPGFLASVAAAEYAGWIGLEYEHTSRSNNMDWMNEIPGFTFGMRHGGTTVGAQPTGGEA
jgi:hydroxypyruvate isomerase